MTIESNLGTGSERHRYAELRDTASDLLAEGRLKTAEAYDVAERVYSDAKDKTYRLADVTNRLVQEHPIAATAIAVSAGAAIAALFPRVRAATKALPAAEKAGRTVVSTLSASTAAAKAGAQKYLESVDTDVLKSRAAALMTEAGALIGEAGRIVAQRAAQIDTDALKAKASDALSEAGKIVAAQVDKVDTDALKAKGLALAEKAKSAAAAKVDEIDTDALKAKAKDVASRAGAAAGEALAHTRDAVTDAVRKVRH